MEVEGDVVHGPAAMERWMFAECVSLRPSRYPGRGRELAEVYDAVMEYFERMHAGAVEIFRQLTPEDLQEKCTLPSGTQIAVWKWLRAMVEHEVHHRGQIYI